MIVNQEIFDEQYLPNQLPHRDAELQQLTRAFEPASVGKRANDVLICGTSGVGKTTVAKYATRQLQDREPVDTSTVRCLGLTEVDILRSVLGDLGLADVAVGEWTAPALADVLEGAVTKPTIVLLDEADALADTRILERLVGVPLLSTVVICHDPTEWLARIDEPLQRRYESTLIELERYGVAELSDILAIRANHGLGYGRITDDQLEDIADRVAGVARLGIQTLRASAELASKRDHRSIQSFDIDDGLELARERIRKYQLASLPFHHHVLYSLIHEAGEISGGELHDRYETIADDLYRDRDLAPIGRRSRRYQLEKLREYDLIAVSGTGKGKSYRVKDGTIAAPIEIEITSSA